jgi:ribosome assembly protein 4
VATMRGHVGPVYQIAWSADSRMVVSASKDSTLKVWNVRTKKMELDLPGHADEVYAVDWSPMVGRAGLNPTLKLYPQLVAAYPIPLSQTIEPYP